MGYAEIEEHLGEIVQVEGNQVKVLIRTVSACSSCHAKGACTASDFKDKYIQSNVGKENYVVGEKVVVECKHSQGFYALFWAYIFPMLLVVGLLFVGISIWNDELKAGVLSLGILPFYYLFLYFQNKVFERKLQMKIKKITR
ncbi:MAG: SoxR reducing system RseC family protein [Flavobacteriaceae bacterium]|nr:SoxR reducing system RseC family protein [Flavobacteriaceae bacterium]